MGVHRPVSGIHQEEAPSAVGVFRLPWLETGLTKKRRLLVPCRPGNGNGAAKEAGIGHAVNLTAGTNLWQHTPWNFQLLQNLLVPLQRVDIKEHGSGGVGVIRYMDPAPGELPDQPGLYRPKI